MASKTVKAGGGLPRVGSKAVKPFINHLLRGMPATKKPQSKTVKSK